MVLSAVLVNCKEHADLGLAIVNVAVPDDAPMTPSVAPLGWLVTALAVLGAVDPEATQVLGTVVLKQTCVGSPV